MAAFIAHVHRVAPGAYRARILSRGRVVTRIVWASQALFTTAHDALCVARDALAVDRRVSGAIKAVANTQAAMASIAAREPAETPSTPTRREVAERRLTARWREQCEAFPIMRELVPLARYIAANIGHVMRQGLLRSYDAPAAYYA